MLHADEPPHPLPPNLNFIIWNCRGTHSPDFYINLCYLLDYHRPALIVLLESHLVDHATIRNGFSFTNMAQVRADGNSGGIVVLWLNDLLIIDEMAITHQEIHCMVQVLPLPTKWLFTAIYASNVYTDRCLLWNNLKCILDTYKGPWLIGGNFNEILHATEKFGGNMLCISRSNNFLNCINYCGLSDLGFKGSKYTWTNKRSKGHTILERLDLLFANYDWIHLFPNAIVTNLPRTHSDYCPYNFPLQDLPLQPLRCLGLKQCGLLTQMFSL